MRALNAWRPLLTLGGSAGRAGASRDLGKPNGQEKPAKGFGCGTEGFPDDTQPSTGRDLGSEPGVRPWEISAPPALTLTFHVMPPVALFSFCLPPPLPSAPHAPHPNPSADYQERFNPSALKDSALSTHKPIEVKGLGGKATIIHAQYNTPISMYSQDAIMDAIAGQAQAQGSDFSG